jgi:hypothetical protein
MKGRERESRTHELDMTVPALVLCIQRGLLVFTGVPVDLQVASLMLRQPGVQLR